MNPTGAFAKRITFNVARPYFNSGGIFLEAIFEQLGKIFFRGTARDGATFYLLRIQSRAPSVFFNFFNNKNFFK